MTGTTASSGDHSSMTGCARDARRFFGKLGEIFGVARFGEARLVQDVLRDRIGHHGGGSAGADVGDGAADRGKRPPVRCSRPAGRVRRLRQRRCRRPEARCGRSLRPLPAPPRTTGRRRRSARRGGAGNRDRRECRTAGGRAPGAVARLQWRYRGRFPQASPSVSARTRAIRLFAGFDHGVLAQQSADTSSIPARSARRGGSGGLCCARACWSWSRSWSRPQTSRRRAA